MHRTPPHGTGFYHQATGEQVPLPASPRGRRRLLQIAGEPTEQCLDLAALSHAWAHRVDRARLWGSAAIIVGGTLLAVPCAAGQGWDIGGFTCAGFVASAVAAMLFGIVREGQPVPERIIAISGRPRPLVLAASGEVADATGAADG